MHIKFAMKFSRIASFAKFAKIIDREHFAIYGSYHNSHENMHMYKDVEIAKIWFRIV